MTPSNAARRRTNVTAVLVVEEAPVAGNQGIHNGHSTVEGQLGDLGGGELAVGVAELDDGLELAGGEGIGDDAVVSCLLDAVLDDVGILQVDGLGDDLRLGLVGGICRQDEFAGVLLVACSVLDELVAADGEMLGLEVISVVVFMIREVSRWRSTHVSVAIRIRDPNEVSVLPFKEHHACLGITVAVGLSEELDEDEGIDRAAPSLLAVHAFWGSLSDSIPAGVEGTK